MTNEEFSERSLGLIPHSFGYPSHAIGPLKDEFRGQLHPALDQVLNRSLSGAL